MTYDPERHRRRSIRLRGYDYAQAGAYFVTVCTQDRACLFGDVADGAMRLNDAGQMVEKWWLEMNRKFSTIETDEYIIMPNHFHGIVVIVGANDIVGVGADLCVCPVQTGAHADDLSAHADDLSAHAGDLGAHAGDLGAHAGDLGAHAGDLGAHADDLGAHAGDLGAHAGAPLPGIIQWFKTMTTNEYIRRVKTCGWPPFRGRLWQRNYYEHIIRDDASLNRIREYIVNNPAQWEMDRENPDIVMTTGRSPQQRPVRATGGPPRPKDEPWRI